jgi:predicted dehydrogenase
MIGDLVSAIAEFSAPIPRNAMEFRWRAELGGGALADLGCYPVHWLRHLAGEEPTVSKAIQILEPNGIDRLSEAHFSFPCGLEANMVTDMDPPHGERRAFVEVIGTKGKLTLINPIAPQYGHDLRLSVDGVESTETFTKRATFAFQLDGVVSAILSGAPVLTEAEDIVGNAMVMAAIRA